MILAVPLCLLAYLVRGVLILFGGFFAVPLSLVGDGGRNTPKIWRFWADSASVPHMSRWQKYVWFAWRNPTPGLKGVWRQPVPEVKPNPDDKVRSLGHKSATRFMRHGWYWEWWHLRQIDWGKYKWFEIRIGWKFVDGNDEFFPTFQFGPRSS